MSNDAQRLEQIRNKISAANEAYARLSLILEEDENQFLKYVGVKDILAKKKSDGYFDYMAKDKHQLQLIDTMRKALLNEEKQISKQVADVAAQETRYAKQV